MESSVCDLDCEIMEVTILRKVKSKAKKMNLNTTDFSKFGEHAEKML